MTAALLVGLFGVAGALLRFGTDAWFTALAGKRAAAGGRAAGGARARGAQHWPWATLVVNVVGSVIIGAAAGVTLRLGLSSDWQLGLATGLAGGLTTFSSWTTATIKLLTERRYAATTANIGANLVLGLAAAAVGMAIVR